MPLRFQGTLVIAAPPERVWTFLVDPHAVSQCLPDVQSLEVVEPGRFKAVVRVGVGFIRGNFGLDLALSDLDPPTHARITGRGGGLGSAVDLQSTVDLAEGEPGSTRLDWSADVVVSGPLASLGGRVLNGTVEKKTAELFSCLKSRLEA